MALVYNIDENSLNKNTKSDKSFNNDWNIDEN